MNATSEQIQEPGVVAEMEEPEIVAGAIADGSQAIAHDGFDVETFEQAADDYARLTRTIEETAGAICTGPALLRDLFWSFHKRAPRIAPVAPLSPAYEVNRQIVEQILSTTEWREMRESGTVSDPLSSAMATIGCATSAVAALDKETIRYVNQLHELTGEVEQLFARAETLNELASLSQDAEKAEQLKEEARLAKSDAVKKEKKAERLNRKLEESSEEREQQVRRAVRQGLAEAMAEVEQANDAIRAFGGGYGVGFGTENGAGGRNSLSTREKLTIAQQVGRSPKLQQIAAVCGRFTRIALQQQKTRVKHPPDEITSITTGNEIERLLPSEISLLADPDLEDLFYLRFAERGLMQYDLIGHEPQGQGPIIIAIDAQRESQQVTDELMPYWRQYRDLFIARDLSQMMREIVDGMNAVSLRQAGGVYFVPASERDSLVRLRQLIAGIPQNVELDPFVCALGVPDAIETKRILSKAVHAGLLDEINSLHTDLGRLSEAGDRLREKTIAQRLVTYKRLKAKTEMYQDLLGMQQDEVRAGIADLEREARNLLAADVASPISPTSQSPSTLFSEPAFAAS